MEHVSKTTLHKSSNLILRDIWDPSILEMKTSMWLSKFESNSFFMALLEGDDDVFDLLLLVALEWNFEL